MLKLRRQLVVLVIMISSCRSIGSQNLNSHTAATTSPANCSGDRKFNDTTGFGFEFDSPRVSMGNAYWSNLASEASYNSQADLQVMLDHMAGVTPRVKFISPGANDKIPAGGFTADFPDGDLLVFRGTQGAADLRTDSDIARIGEEVYYGGHTLGTAQLHKGFWTAVDNKISDVLFDYLSWQDSVNYQDGSEQAFVAISRTIRGIMIPADESTYDDTIGLLIQLGLLGVDPVNPNVDRDKILEGLNEWKGLEIALAQAHEDKSLSKIKVGEQDEDTLRKKHLIASRLQKFWRFRSYKPLWLTGHSLGGSEAIISAYRLLKLGIPITGIITFGEPGVGNDVFRDLMKGLFTEDKTYKNMLRFVQGNDGVALLGVAFGLVHINQSIYIDGNEFFHFPEEAPNSELVAMLGKYAGHDFARFYTGARPKSMPTVAKIELENMLKDHSNPLYLERLEKFVFGKPAAGCVGELKE